MAIGTTRPASQAHVFAGAEFEPLNVADCVGTVLFFLPAVGTNASSMPGWQCAARTLQVWNTVFFICGLSNPMLIAYLALCYFASWPRVQTILACVVLFICLPVTWWLLTNLQHDSGPMYMEIGHVLWIAGIVLLTAPEVTRWKIHLEAGAR